MACVARAWGPDTAVLSNGERTMTFILHVSIPVKDENGWHGNNHWPTLLLVADTEEDAWSKVQDIQKDLPDGASLTAVPF